MAERLLEIEPIHFMDTKCKSMNAEKLDEFGNDQIATTSNGMMVQPPMPKSKTLIHNINVVANDCKNIDNVFNNDIDDDDFEFF